MRAELDHIWLFMNTPWVSKVYPFESEIIEKDSRLQLNVLSISLMFHFVLKEAILVCIIANIPAEEYSRLRKERILLNTKSDVTV
jgi:hypothetical protein